jgi:hypothetical protein
MTVTSLWTCDYCGGAIYGPYFARFTVAGHGVDLGSGDDMSLDFVHHYHAGEAGSCYRKAYDALLLAEDFGPTLEPIPTISTQAVAARRRKHHREDGS